MQNNILAIDTSTEYCLLSLKIDNIIYNKIHYSPYSHIKCILQLLNNLLKEKKITLSTICLLGYNLGPGNFTSLRIGIAIIESLSYVLNIPKIGISHLMILAEQSWKITGIKNVISVIKCNQNLLYFAIYKRTFKGLWIGKKSECLLNYNDFFQKIILLKGIFVLISNIDQYFQKNIKKKIGTNLKITFVYNKFLSSENIISIINTIFLNKKKVKKNYQINYIKNIF
ncbi:tRNA (adenosine(37)-N6)-threonylcarbamoyltransferase complex dimerization subunit type 1 TsaB [Enterobacteriaceae endosymbiont of Donacia cincticornis]|uniref:tRNA (adenosine(37)-N6)-threonylcarbamoyltransferase complex dimerization subunit type 1 TsaB n=1 Tax=Enterobacteriaceae endosymbiont of Donacia cincticornis TaxID=2675773 RepID=UPI001449D14A|nr:tRNA (adenosine(37)-N6)-threonylcarbamoyltransferase complex dimerization subunit type 1 TsaB [Enterobacteriaceae endosymbiont of Donacia cincticornis]QJC36013.1 tRNA (adenosine(37)-N6)-threonylcarbamoyltransferase complex dimerization subunit type 1 TsaB [Enterobacteriaceae endosymbiont of Donacia cincticornis]